MTYAKEESLAEASRAAVSVVEYGLSRVPIPAAEVELVDRGSQRVALIHDLEHGGALTTYQGSLLLDAWPDLDSDWAANPYFGTVREHARAYIDQLWRSDDPTTPQGGQSHV
jgi:hypothetical protein